jgi:hypothetical protein
LKPEGRSKGNKFDKVSELIGYDKVKEVASPNRINRKTCLIKVLANLSNSVTPAKAGVQNGFEQTGFRLSPE